jgi:RimJ/RimL family protein N-acetyltransferase
MADVFLETERLVLRRFTESDVDDIVELDGDPAVMRYLTGGRSTPRELVENDVLPRFLRYYEHFRPWGFWATEERGTGRFVGWFVLRPREGEDPVDSPELGYRLRRECWGRGYGTEGARALVTKAFTDLGARRVYAHTMAVNLGSRRVMEKAGLRFVRTFHAEFDDPIPGSEHGEVEYALTREEWLASPG